MTRKSLIPLLIGLTLILGYYVGVYTTPSTKSGNERLQKIEYLLKLIEDNHLSKASVDSILEHSIEEMLHELDPHSAYLNPEEVKRAQENMTGRFVGIGIEFNHLKDSIRVLSVVPNGPSAKAGLRGGDIILQADTVALFGSDIQNHEIIAQLKGRNRSKVALTVLRNRDTLTFNVKRGEISIPSVDLAYHPSDGVGYIRITRFNEQTTAEFDRALTSLRGNIQNGLIIDVRDNPGGLLNQAVQVTSRFLNAGDTIVFLENNKGQRDYYINKQKSQRIDAPLVVLINEGSASAAEILAGAIQDNDRGLVIGRRSFGKGLVQEEVGLPDGSKIRLTTSRYFTPSGRIIQKSYANGYNDYQQEVMQRYHKSAPNSDTAGMPIYQTRSGRTIYGGGGVRPDIDQRYDTTNTLNSSAFYHLGDAKRMLQLYRYAAVHYDSLQALEPDTIWATPNSKLIKHVFGKHFSDTDNDAIGRFIKQQIILMVFDRPTMSQYSMKNDPFIEVGLQAIKGGTIDTLLNVAH